MNQVKENKRSGEEGVMECVNCKQLQSKARRRPQRSDGAENTHLALEAVALDVSQDELAHVALGREGRDGSGGSGETAAFEPSFACALQVEEEVRRAKEGQFWMICGRQW